MRIDIHGHFGPAGSGAAPAARVSLYAAACKLDYVLVSNRGAAADVGQDEVDANFACLRACREHTRLAPVYWVRPGQLDSHVYAFRGALETGAFAAACFAPAENDFNANDPRLDGYLTMLEAAGRPALFCVTGDPRAAPAKIHELARRHSQVPIVLCLCGTGNPPRAAALDVVGHASRQADADLYVDTAGATASEIVQAARSVGPDRVLFGSDALRRADAHVPSHIAILDELRNSLPAKEFASIVGDNAARLFRLGPQPR